MADIQQWRRMIQTTRVRTPALEDTDELLSPTTPKQRGLKSKVSSYFDLGTQKSSFGQEESAESQLPTWPLDQLYPDPNAEDEMDSLMCRLMTEPHTPLDVRFNGCLMRIFEGYLKLKDERDLLQRHLDQEAAACQMMLNKYNMAEKDWQDEKQDFKEEVKRLEVLLSKASKRGLAEVTLARQDSKLRSRKRDGGDHKETIFEFLEKTKLLHPSDSFYENQRATMKPIFQSPSDKDKKISQKLSQKKSMTNIHAELPFGTPPSKDVTFSLTNVSMLEQQALQKPRNRAATNSTDTSEDTFSAFSAEGDLFQETAGQAKAEPPLNREDSSEIERLANAIAVRRNVDPGSVMPQLLNLFPASSSGPENQNTSSVPAGLGIAVMPARSNSSARVVSGSMPMKRQSALSKASGFFNKLRPQLSVDNTNSARSVPRRFSFEPGDDGAAQNVPAAVALPSDNGDRFLRKSVSLDALQQILPATATGADEKHSLSPVAASPTPSAPAAEGRPPSRIPTPVYNSGYLAKPRQEREDSASSLLTAIKSAEEAGKRSNSLSSSVYSTPSMSREDLTKASQPAGVEPGLKTQNGSSNRLLDHTNTLRGSSNVASAAARAASISSETIGDPRAVQTQPSAQSRSGCSNKSNKHQDSRSENAPPMVPGRIRIP